MNGIYIAASYAVTIAIFGWWGVATAVAHVLALLVIGSMKRPPPKS
jgi:hypothetical protein